jgi:hypothetical protein
MPTHEQSDERTLPPMTAQDYSEVPDWPGYFRTVLGKDPRETLIKALDAFEREGFTRAEVLTLLHDFEVEMMREEERDDPPELRKPKHWQLFHVVARKH